MIEPGMAGVCVAAHAAGGGGRRTGAGGPFTDRESTVRFPTTRLVPNMRMLAVMDWKDNILTDRRRVSEFLRTVRNIAVLGIKPESHAGQPSHYVAAALARAGLNIIPVPVYFPDTQTILGKKVYRSLAAVPEPIDIVDVFRRSADIPPHLDDMIAAKPKMVWFQSGIRHDEAARQLAEAGILVVQDRCLMVDYGA